MHIESGWMKDIQRQGLFNAPQLTTLAICMPWVVAGSDHIEWILDQGPNLYSLSLSDWRINSRVGYNPF